MAWFVPMLVATIAYFQYDQTDPEGRLTDIQESQMLAEYDFIVIGSGSAGELIIIKEHKQLTSWLFFRVEHTFYRIFCAYPYIASFDTVSK